jgi:hypothetical protein
MEGFPHRRHAHSARGFISSEIGAIYRGIGYARQPLDLDCQPISRYVEKPTWVGIAASEHKSGLVQSPASQAVDLQPWMCKRSIRPCSTMDRAPEAGEVV